MDNIWLVSLTIFLPTLVAIGLSFVPKGANEWVRLITLATTVVTFGLVIGCVMMPFDLDAQGIQNAFAVKWIPSFDIDYYLGIDGISLPLVVLTGFVCIVAMIASWSIKKNVKAYCMLFLILETGMLGVFMALDFFLFYVFWEVMLLPMYFLIGIWGGPRKEYAAIKFFLYTLFGSVLMLIAILMLYFASDLNVLQDQGIDLASLNIRDEVAVNVAGQLDLPVDQRTPTHTFNITALAVMGQQTDLFSTQEYWFGWSLQHWAFVLLLIGFLIKVPSVPVHTWLPDAHVEAPTPISMILAGVLLKMGGYGIIRICYPICPHAGYDFSTFVCTLGVVSMVYGAFAALAQKDFKRMVAYSSVSHMGYVVLGLGVWSATAGTMFDQQSWNMGIKGAMFQMIGHGVSSAGMFFMVGVVYDRVHHRNLNEFGGLYGKMPLYTALAMIVFFAGLGLPGLCGFIGEVFVVLSVWKYSITLAVISASVVILTAGYILWAIQRVYLGAEYKGPHEEALTPITVRELTVAVPLVVFAVYFGVNPNSVLKYMDATIDHQVQTLADWTRTTKMAELQAEADADDDAATEQVSDESGTSESSTTQDLIEASAAVATPSTEDVVVKSSYTQMAQAAVQ
ncbi:MAG: NADH-quinone oxidoreductase subunit M [Planctomycetales bacterium]|nr:NADH-quinone oxidoreductase subunit M [Planctomycetales bacterium]